MQNHPAPSIQSTATRPPTASTFKPRVRRLGAGLYLVESTSTPGLGHQATATSCGCRAGQFGKTCRHQCLVAAIEPRFQAWYGQLEKREQREGQATPVVAPVAIPVAGLDAQLAAAEQLLSIKRRALADAHPQSDEYAPLLRAVDQAERHVAALDARAMRAA